MFYMYYNVGIIHAETIMTIRPPIIGNFEELILLAILKLGNESYGVPIRHALGEALQKEVSAGALYTTLERLEQKGYVSSWQGEPSSERGGRAKRYYKVEGAGMAALSDAERARSAMRVAYKPVGDLV
jgi:PadR family transcriptional regulator PadR